MKRGERPVGIRDDDRMMYVALGALALIFGLGCPEATGGGGGFSNVNGTIMGESFQMYGGVAEAVGGGYAITLTDSSGYDCYSTPNSKYLQVSWEAGGVGSSSAAGNVTFSSVEGNVSPAEGAVSGTVTLDQIDTVNNLLSGSISARGSESEVSGSFEVEICP